MRPMPRPRIDPFSNAGLFGGEGPLLDVDALEAPRRLSRDEGRAVAGPDWSWIHLPFDEETDND